MEPVKIAIGQNWTPWQDHYLATFAAAGWSASAIAKSVNRTKNAVIGRARRKGIKLLHRRGLSRNVTLA